MREKEPDRTRFDVGEQGDVPGVNRFAHSAMATVFEVHCSHRDARYAGQAAQAAFDLVDRLEMELSRFIGNSDISRINSLEAGETTRVSLSTMECLQAARLLYGETLKAFDVSIGTGFEKLGLDAEALTVFASEEGVRLDLGGIGKGYAVDRIAELLEEWEVDRALIHGGFSSVIALEPPLDKPGWPLKLSRPGAGDGKREVLVRISARQRALSASGIQKKDHIVNPRDGQPVQDRLAAWVSLPRVGARRPEGTSIWNCRPAEELPAAMAEGLSTAFMILPVAEVSSCCGKWAGSEAWLIPTRSAEGPDASDILYLSGPAGAILESPGDAAG